MVDFTAKLKAQRAAKAAIPKEPKRSARGKYKPPKDYVPPPELSSLEVPTKARIALMEMMDEHYSITEKQRELKKRKTTLTEDMKELCILYGLTGFQSVGMQTSYYPITKAVLDKGMLLAAGVTLEKIIMSTKVSESWGLKVSPIADVDATEEEEDEY